MSLLANIDPDYASRSANWIGRTSWGSQSIWVPSMPDLFNSEATLTNYRVLDKLLMAALQQYEQSSQQYTKPIALRKKLDELFLETSQLLDVEPLDNPVVVKTLGKHQFGQHQFGQPQSEKDIQAVPKKALQNTEWAKSIWREWATHRLEQQLSTENCGFGLDSHSTNMSTPAVNHWLQRLVIEVRKVSSEHYCPDSLHVGCKQPLSRSS